MKTKDDRNFEARNFIVSLALVLPICFAASRCNGRSDQEADGYLDTIEIENGPFVPR